jgi:predicted metal-binding membrane protein
MGGWRCVGSSASELSDVARRQGSAGRSRRAPHNEGVRSAVTQTKLPSPAATQATRVTRATRRAVWVGSVLLALLAWIPTVQQSRGMGSMWSIPGTMGMPLGAFLVFWMLMIVAMMGPSVAPIASLHLEAARPQARGLHLVACGGAFVLGYLLVWTACGLPIFGLAALEGHLAGAAPPVIVAVGATILVAAGVYQLTPLQARRLASCNLHLGAQAHLLHAQGAAQDVRAGLAHGVDCLGACGGCMLALVAVGLMNLPWMVALTLIVWVEKVWRHGDHLAVVVGLGLVLLGILAAADPRLIRGL